MNAKTAERNSRTRSTAVPPPDLNTTAASVLAELRKGPANGSQLAARMERNAGPVCAVTRSQVYRELLTLEEWGCVRPISQRGRGGPPLQITHEGMKALRKWLREQPGDDIFHSPALLRAALACRFSPSDPRQVTRTAQKLLVEREADGKEAAKLADTPAAQAVARFQHDLTRAAVKLASKLATMDAQ